MKTASFLSGASIAALAIQAAVGDAAGAWMLLVPAGKFTARDGRRFDTGDRAEMEAIVARTKQYHSALDIVVDYDHQSVFGAKDGVGGTARAAGWIKELQVRDDGIWGRVEWTSAALEAIKAGEYRYLSPVIPHRKSDGRVFLILNAALTNTPALDLEAAAASVHFPKLEEGNDMDKILAALGLAKGTGEDGVLSAIAAHLTSSTAIAKAAGLTETAKPEDVLSVVAQAVADRSRIAKALGLTDDAKADDIVAALSAKTPDPSKFVPIAALTEIRTELAALKSAGVDEKAENAVDAAIKAGQVTPSQKDWALAYAKKDLAGFQTFVGAAPVLTASQMAKPKRDTENGDVLNDAQLAVCKALGLTPKAYAETLKAEQAN